ncbi:MAG TPA: hypothetical protein VKA09_03940 [Nitrososphaeraceae archaeon]|nr:hypothetical protein [Nitrososphaeraceae archaeon]
MATATTTTKFLGAYVNQDTLEKLDKHRGRIPRSRIIEDALIYFLTTPGEHLNKK